jgi:hypothetical protein
MAMAALLLGAAGPTQTSTDADRTSAQGGLWIDAERGVVALRAQVLVKEDLLEYLLVAPHGAAHESLFVTELSPTVLNATLVALGAQPGSNARWEELAPDPDDPARDPFRVHLPDGGPRSRFLPYVAWREDGETYFFRVEDVVTNLATGRSMRRHPWVYLGSRFATLRSGKEEVFVAEAEGNLVNISFFFEGNTLFTSALEACESQTIWVANRALLPPTATPVVLLFARERLARFPDEWAAALDVGPAPDGANGE